MNQHKLYMQRCIDLALKGAGTVAPNPMVGAVLVYNGCIIGEGYHKKYGEAHAEVNCIHAVNDDDKKYIPDSIMYVSLEPCAHFGKTPPCADLIIAHGIKKVVIGSSDPFEEVNGQGIEKLRNADVEVVTGILENECINLNKRFFTFHINKRPYIILKWAQTRNGKIAAPRNPPKGGTLGNVKKQRTFITNEYTNRIVHKWRSEEASILVGTNTAMADDPELTNRLWKGPSPIRLVIDMDLKLPDDLKMFDKKIRTIIFNKLKQEDNDMLSFIRIKETENIVQQICNALYEMKIQSIFVEGGAKLLQSFIDIGLWDEARIITNKELMIAEGLDAPVLVNSKMESEEKVFSDRIKYYKPQIIIPIAIGTKPS